MKNFFRLFLFQLISTVGFCSPASSKENILICVTQQHSTASISSFGNFYSSFQVTKNIDSLANNGTIFKHAFCSTASSELGLLSLLSGKNVFGHNYNLSEVELQHLSTIKHRGYRTAFFGAWNLKGLPNCFDHWEILTDPKQIYNPKIKSNDKTRKIEGHSTDIIADITIDWLKKQSQDDNPKFIIVYFNGTNRPWMPPIRFLEYHNDHLLPEPKSLRTDHSTKAPASRYQEMQIDDNLDLRADLFLSQETNLSGDTPKSKIQDQNKMLQDLNTEQLTAWQLALRPQNEAFIRSNLETHELISWKYQRFAKNYLRCVRAIDENIGRICDYISPVQKNKEWIICYSACSGNFMGENGWFGGNWMYEQSMRIPFIISGGNLNLNRVVNRQVQLIDLLPTVLELSKTNKFEGRNLKQWGQNINTDQEIILYFEHDRFPHESMVAKHYGIRTKTFKLIHFHQFDEWELFDLSKDPTEQKNIYNDPSYIEISNGLKLKLQERRLALGLSELEKAMPEEWRRIYRGPNARSKTPINLP